MTEPESAQGKQIINLSWQRPEWNWLAHRFPELHWIHRTCWGHPLPLWVPKHAMLVRMHAGFQAAMDARRTPSILVSHGPIPASYGAFWKSILCPSTRHLLFGFNFTELPRGIKLRWMRHAFRHVDRFTVFSSMEKALYAKHFDLALERFDMVHWSARPLQVDRQEPPLIDGPYLCAIGSQGRDYRTLMQAMAQKPDLKLVVVVNPENLRDCKVPANVKVLTQIPLKQVANILAHSRFMALPLRDAEVPCGHVTIVSAFHEGKAIVATDSTGIQDYLEHGVTGILTPSQDATALAEQLQRLWDDPASAEQLGRQGQAFGALHCSEESAMNYFATTLNAWAR
jgi:glycosyltransferase involved in cell wall biosynthesis